MSDTPLSVVVLISGRGSNLQALLDATRSGKLNARIVAVISNVPDATGLERARAAGIDTDVVDHTTFATRAEFDRVLLERIEQHRPDLIVLAGFMRVLTAELVAHFSGRLINIHPSLLPAFPGLHTHRQALAAGVSEHGVTVHFVTAQLDGGPAIAQARVPVFPGDDEDALADRVLQQEHRLLPYVVDLFAARRLRLGDDARVHLDDQLLATPVALD